MIEPAWDRFARDFVAHVDAVWAEGRISPYWRKTDRSRVTALDLRLDLTVRICLAEHFSDVPVLSEETGMLSPLKNAGSTLAIVDPVDGTDSLIQGNNTWWISVGLVQSGKPLAGIIYQPPSRRLHDSRRPKAEISSKFIVGLSPDQLTADESASITARLRDFGAALIGTPHAVEKIAAVVEGRAAATIYLPSKKSPSWRIWDIAACLPIAEANGLVLRTLSGRELRIDPTQAEYNDPWMCASDESTWESVRNVLVGHS